MGRHDGNLASRTRHLAAILVALAVAVATAACGGGGSSAHTPTSSKGVVFVISPSEGSPDTRIFVSGCGFEPNKTVTFEASDLGSFPTTASDASGAFQTETIVPSIGPGTHIVRASTSGAVFAEAVFTIEAQTGDIGESPTPQSSPQVARC